MSTACTCVVLGLSYACVDAAVVSNFIASAFVAMLEQYLLVLKVLACGLKPVNGGLISMILC